MAIFTFSTKDKKPQDEEIVRKLKEHCARRNINFSAVVVAQIRRYAEEQGIEHRRN